ncbi:hypothetical protein GLYMA_16G175800v4 [Glycine max]|nr:hypothetical protein GLYMA_16G175800v4 [Glycine max]
MGFLPSLCKKFVEIVEILKDADSSKQDSNKRKKDGSISCSLRKNRRSSIAGEEDKGGKTSRQLRKQAARKPANSSFNEDVEDLEGTNLNLLLDHGMFYASNSFFDYAKNRRILWGWSKECETTQDDYEKGWAGLQSIPRQVWLHKSGKWLMQWPIEEVEKLHDKQVSIMGEKLVSESTIEVSGIPASQVDVEVWFELPELENMEWLNESEVDPHLLCSEEYASRSGIIGMWPLVDLLHWIQLLVCGRWLIIGASSCRLGITKQYLGTHGLSFWSLQRSSFYLD